MDENTSGISELKEDLDNFGDSFRRIKPDALSVSLRCELIDINNLITGSPAATIGSSKMNHVNPDITWAKSTKPIKVSPNDVIIITIPANCVTSDSDYGTFFYDSNGTLLRIDRTQPYTVKKKITVQENERYIVINHYFPGKQWLSAKYTNNPFGNDSYELSGLKIASENVYGSVLPNQWVGKKCAAIGCSVTQMGVWTDVVKSYFKFSKMYNRGLGGTTLANFKPYNVSNYVEGTYVYSDESLYDESNNTVFYNESNPLSEDKKWVNAWYSSDGRINLLPTDADLVLIDMATNDFYRSLNKDYVTGDEFLRDSLINSQWTESQNPAVYDDKYFCDAFMLTIKRIMTRCPNARLVVWGMMYNGSLSTENGAMQYYRRMIDKIKYMCDVTGVYFIDTMSEMGVNLFNFTEYIDDGVHPQSTSKGGYAIASVIISHLRNLYPKDYFVN